MSYSDVSCLARPHQAPRLSQTVEGVEFWIASDKGARTRCVITEGALRGHYAAGEGADSWLEAFESHQPDIEARALAACARRDDVHVVIATDLCGELKTIAGRCGT